ncbi:MAG TPA: hypothetical protein VLC46_19805 [Thermoanaerobaculia bacterium]|jgi:hypothetical protein|nr:hypothetical protein [Thermoanaerobaculia bacterium]
MTACNRILALCSSLLLLASIAAAETIRFDPPGATAHHSVDVIVTGSWPNGCLPSVENVTVNGSTIQLRLDSRPPLGVLCSQLVSPYSGLFHLDVLPAGTYTVSLLADNGGNATELARTPLVVRDAETLRIPLYALPTSGGLINVFDPFPPDSGVSLTIDGVAVPSGVSGDGVVLANAPPHLQGAVDVAVSSSQGTVTAKAALIYYDPASTDPAVFEPILFPLSFQGAGAFGSQWTTESFIAVANGSSAFFRDPLPCALCSSTLIAGSSKLDNDTNPWGHVLYAVRGSGPLDFTSRVRDTSRQAQTAGTEVPVVRGSDFRPQVRFQNVPVDSRYRVMLRLWSFGNSPFNVLADTAQGQQLPLSLIKIPGTSMWFGSLDVTSLLAKGGASPTLVTVSPSGSPLLSPQIWGMLGLTNNDTQQVTIISPQ